MMMKSKSGFVGWCIDVVSDPEGNPSSTRILMFVFSIFSMILIWRCFFHIFQLNNTVEVTIWLSNMPTLVASLIGLISLPYGINKGTSTFLDIANMMANTKNHNVTTAIAELKDAVNKATSSNGPTTIVTTMQPTNGLVSSTVKEDNA